MRCTVAATAVAVVVVDPAAGPKPGPDHKGFVDTIDTD